MFIAFFALWIVFIERITMESCVLGLVISFVLSGVICRLSGKSLFKEYSLYGRFRHILIFSCTIIRDIVVSNIAVARLILSDREVVSPALVRFKTKLKTPVGRALRANCITLTPGTISVLLENDELLVYALDEQFVDGLETDGLEDIIGRLEEV